MASINAEDLVRMSDMVADVFNVLASASGSLTRYSKTTAVVSRVYIEEGVANEDIAAPLMGTLTQIYISYVLTALQLNNVIGNYEVVRSAVQRVATENYVDVEEAISEDFGNLNIDTEGSKILELDKATADLASGTVIEFDFIVGQTDKGQPTTVTVPIHVSLIPAAVTTKVAKAFMDLSFIPSLSRRWKMWKAGEISLFKDFIFAKDLVAKYRSALKEDSTNALRDMMDSKNKGWMRMIKGIITRTPNNNAASSILVFDAKTFEEACKEAHINFATYKDRQKFFSTAMAMLVVVVDTMYDTVDIYYNGLEQHSSVPYRIIEKAGKGNQGVDLKEFMSSLSKGTPKF